MHVMHLGRHLVHGESSTHLNHDYSPFPTDEETETQGGRCDSSRTAQRFIKFRENI